MHWTLKWSRIASKAFNSKTTICLIDSDWCMTNDSNAGPQQGLGRRRSQRVYVQIRVRVEGYLKNKTHFAEDTGTFAVNAHGALVGLNAEPRLGQSVNLRNVATNETQECKVVFVIMA